MKSKLILVLIVFTIISCSKEEATGTIKYSGDVAADGCGWIIQIGSNNYKPTNLDAQYQINNLTVEIQYKKLNSKATCSLTPNELEEIEILEIN